jgi:uncharacterized protein (DUF4415 family)
MGKIIRMTAREIDKELTPDKIKAMVVKAKVSEDDNSFSSEEWWAKAERPNRGRPVKEVVKQDIHIRLNPFTLEKLKTLGRGWQTKLSAKIDEWVMQELL